MTPETLVAMIDALLGDVEEDREPRTIWLGRNQMFCFQKACLDPTMKCMSTSSVAGVYRNTQVQLYSANAEAVSVSTMPKGGF